MSRKKRMKPKTISTQTTVNLDIPDLFCFPQVEPPSYSPLSRQIRLIHHYEPSFNVLAGNKTRPYIYPYEISLLVDAIKYAISIRNRANKTEWLRVIFKLGLALHLIATRTQNGGYHLTDSASLIDVLCDFSNELTDQPEELWWYYAGALNLQIGWNHDETQSRQIVHKLTACLDNIQDKRYLRGVAYFIQHIIDQGYFYPDITTFQKIASVCPEKIKEHECESITGLKRDIYISKRYINKDYLQYSSTTGLEESNKSQRLTVDFTTTQLRNTETPIKISISVSPYVLIQFAAHLIPPSKPILKLVIPGLSATENDTLNTDIKNKLRSERFCNSEGMLTKEFYKDKNASPIKRIITDFIHRFVQESRKSYPNGRQAYERQFDSFTQEAIMKKEAIEKLRDDVAGFNRLEALTLCYNCLVHCEYGLNLDLLEKVKRSLAICITILIQAENINTRYSHKEKHKRWFEFARNIVDMVEKKEPILIATGTPIPEGQKSSTHAIYASLKKLDENKVTVSITNGGQGVSKFHKLSDTWNDKDIGSKRYNYAGFITPLDTEHKEALTHYVYKLISLRHEISALDDEEISVEERDRRLNPYLFSNLLSNIYLRTSDASNEEFFTGQNGREFTLFKRQDFKADFREQVAGTCSVHNLIRSLKFLFDMNELEFGQLQHNLSIGFDQLITTLKETQHLPTFQLRQ